jgi:hypothetical protein
VAGFVIHRLETVEGPEYMWFLDIGGPDDAIASFYKPTSSEEDALAEIRRLKEADLAGLHIYVREEAATARSSRSPTSPVILRRVGATGDTGNPVSPSHPRFLKRPRCRFGAKAAVDGAAGARSDRAGTRRRKSLWDSGWRRAGAGFGREQVPMVIVMDENTRDPRQAMASSSDRTPHPPHPDTPFGQRSMATGRR